MSAHHLTVLRDFGTYRAGDHIEGEAEVARILGGEMARHVVKVAADVKPAQTPPALPDTALPGASPKAVEKE